MGVIKTNKWVELYLAHSEEQTIKSRYMQLFIQPLQSLFSFPSNEELASFLIRMGMFRPGADLELQELINGEHWEVARDHFKTLKERWAGPNIPVYLLLADARLKQPSRGVGGKMGLSFADGILLLIPNDISEFDLKALLTHEYHHVCRLLQTKETEESITFLESAVMEGLAEMAVKEEVGSDYAAPWTKYYTDSWKEEWYPRFIEKRLSQKGRRFYKDVLYGKESMGIPKMLGYYYGYMICLKAAERLNKQTLALMQMPAETILKTALEK